MPNHAMAMVKWEVFRSAKSGGRYSRSYVYACKQKRLVNLVGDGGTLWLVTSRRKPGEPRRYSLAYKLVDCRSTPPWQEKAEEFGDYMVSAQDWVHSIHFPYNDATELLLRLRFTTGHPLAASTQIGNRLLSIPQLTADDIALLDAFQQKILSERAAFLSYSRKNSGIACRLENELEQRGVHLFRDATALELGEDWQAALARAVRAADFFLVLVSSQAAASNWVRQEIAWAIAECRQGGLVERIIPIVLTQTAWQSFPELHGYQKVIYPRKPEASFFDHLASELASLPRHK
jgi:hypothetical protein